MSTTDVQENEIVGRECRFAVHMGSVDGSPDYHLVKEAIHYKDGTIRPHVHFEKDFKRPFGVTKKQYQNHQQKKEFEHFEKLHIYHCTQSELPRTVARALGRTYGQPDLRQLSASPYLYGTDITSTSILKETYLRKYPGLVSEYSVATFDIETDVLHGTDDPILATLVFEDKIHVVGLRSFFKGSTELEERFYKTANKYIKPHLDAGEFKLEFKVVDEVVELIRCSINKAHEWKPDFLSIWNMDFDIPRILDTLKKYDTAPEDIFCDPVIPKKFRFCHYKKGMTQQKTASGAVKPKNPSEQWHCLQVPASFYVIDAMCSYRFLRQGAQEESDYKLNTILTKVMGMRKLDFPEADHITSSDVKWHEFMQANYPFEYAVYNVFDSLSMMLMERKTRDLASSLPVMCKLTDFAKFNSQSRKVADQFFFFLYLTRDRMLGTVAPSVKKNEDVDEEIVEDTDDPTEGDEDEDSFVFDEDATVLSLRQWIDKNVSYAYARTFQVPLLSNQY